MADDTVVVVEGGDPPEAGAGDAVTGAVAGAAANEAVHASEDAAEAQATADAAAEAATLALQESAANQGVGPEEARAIAEDVIAQREARRAAEATADQLEEIEAANAAKGSGGTGDEGKGGDKPPANVDKKRKRTFRERWEGVGE